MFDDSEHHRRMSKAIADRPARSGLERGMLDSGDVVTFSRNKVNGDRSYIDSVWQVTATNGVQVALRWVGGAKMFLSSDPTIMLMLDEHEFYDGRMFVATNAQAGGEEGE